MKCAYCKHNDGVVYTSNPPKYRCSVTGEYHLALDDCNVEFAPIKHGRWEQVEVVHDRKDAKIQDWQQAKCSVCGRWHTTPFMYYLKLDNYCPNCGARMDEVEE